MVHFIMELSGRFFQKIRRNINISASTFLLLISGCANVDFGDDIPFYYQNDTFNESELYLDTDTDTDTNSEADTDVGTDNDTDTNSDSDTDTELDDDNDTDTDSDTDSDADMNAGTDNDVNTDNDHNMDTNSDSDNGSDSDTDTDTDSDTDTDTDTDSDPDTYSDAGTDTDADSDTIGITNSDGGTNTDTGNPEKTVFEQSDDSNGLVIIEAEEYSSQRMFTDESFWKKVFEPSDYSGTGAMKARYPVYDAYKTTSLAEDYAPVLEYRIRFVKAEPVYVWARASHTDEYDDSTWFGVDGDIEGISPLSFLIAEQSYINEWHHIGHLMGGDRAVLDIDEVGLKTFELYPREHNFIIDKIILTTNEDYSPEDSL